MRMLEETILQLSSKFDQLEQQHDETLTPVHSNVVTTNHTASTESDDFRFSSEIKVLSATDVCNMDTFREHAECG